MEEQQDLESAETPMETTGDQEDLQRQSAAKQQSDLSKARPSRDGRASSDQQSRD